MYRIRRALPLLLTLLFGAVVFGPGLIEGTSRFFGREYVDAWGTQWFYWFTARQVAHGEGFGWSDLFFYPWGKDVYLHTGGNVLDGLLAWPLRAVLGPVAGYNTFVLAIVATNVWAMRRLLIGLGAKAEAAGLAAVFFAFNPWALHELRDGRPTQALLAFVLLFLADYLALDQARRVVGNRVYWLPLRAGFWLALAGLTYWYTALFAGMAAGLLAVWRTAVARERGRTLVRHALAGGVALVLVAPFVLPMFGASDVPGLLDVSKWTWTTWTPTTREGVRIGLYVFDPGSLGSGFWAEKNDGGMAFLREDSNVYLAQVLLAALGLLVAPRRVRAAGLALCAVAFFVSIGPALLGVPNPIYHLLVRSSSVFQRLWWPSRALMVGHLGLAILSGYAFSRLRGLAPVVAIGVAGAWIFELTHSELGPMATWSADIPAVYRCVAAADDGAIIELPYGRTQAHLYFQTAHGRPLFGGMLEDNVIFAPAAQVAFRQSNRYAAALIDQSGYGERRPEFSPQDREQLHEMGYRWVVFDKQPYAAQEDSAVPMGASLVGRGPFVYRQMGMLLGAPVWEDATHAIYAPWGDGSPCP